MRHRFLCLCAVLCTITVTHAAKAWHEPGHMLTALVAYEQLDNATRDKLVAILEQHPRFTEDFKAAMPDNLPPDERGRWLFCRASIWPDLVRKRGDGHVPSSPNIKTSYHRSHWHFINEPIVLLPKGAETSEEAEIRDAAKAGLNLSTDPPAQETLKMNALQAIAFNSNVLKNGTDAEKAVAVCWLLHLVGDIHQPLHSTALFSREMFNPVEAKEGDRGGNSISFGESKNDNLHSLWDDAPDNNNRFGHILDRTQELLEDNDLLAAGEQARAVKDPKAWAKESFELAKKNVYTASVRRQLLHAEKLGFDPAQDTLIDLPTNYKAAAKKVADRRVVEGGFRLAGHLKASMP